MTTYHNGDSRVLGGQWVTTVNSYRGTKYPEVPCNRCGCKITMRPERSKVKLCGDCKHVTKDLNELESWV